MAKYRQAAKVDNNQKEIVKALRTTGFNVKTGCDDVLVGKYYKTNWFEIKNSTIYNKNKTLKMDAIKDSQYKVLWNWQGQYAIVWNVEQIWSICEGKFSQSMNVINTKYPLTPELFRKHYRKLLKPKKLNKLRLAGIINDGVKVRELCGTCMMYNNKKWCECEY